MKGWGKQIPAHFPCFLHPPPTSLSLSTHPKPHPQPSTPLCAPNQVRKAFKADTERGNTLIVADYGQLELRVLAHMAGCVSMQEAFKLGGDFHSRTALGMYDHIQRAVDEGEGVSTTHAHTCSVFGQCTRGA